MKPADDQIIGDGPIKLPRDIKPRVIQNRAIYVVPDALWRPKHHSHAVWGTAQRILLQMGEQELRYHPRHTYYSDRWSPSNYSPMDVQWHITQGDLGHPTFMQGGRLTTNRLIEIGPRLKKYVGILLPDDLLRVMISHTLVIKEIK